MTHAGFLLFPRLTQLDLTGPYEVLSRMTGSRVDLVWKTKDPVESDAGLRMIPSMTMKECPQLDVICVPGGPGQIAIMDDSETLAWLTGQAEKAAWVTSVCTGSLILGAAGLLRGYRAACHWMSRDQLRLLGAEPSASRVVLDRNRLTGGGVTAGIDFALELVALLRDENEARRIALQLEYDPAPPFGPGSPDCAELELITALQQRAKPMLQARREATERAARRIGTL